MKLKYLNLSLITVTAVRLACAPSAHAAPITWSDPVTVAGDSDVSTAGTLLAAYSLNTGAVTVNGVAFADGSASLSSLGTTFTMTAFTKHYAAFGGGTSAPYGNLSTAYQTLLANGDYVGNLNTTPVLTLQNLTFGEKYAIQVWANDSRTGRATNNYANVYSTGGGNNVRAYYNNTGVVGGLGQWTMGTFVADGPTQSFIVYGNAGSGMGDTYLNALQVRDLGPATFGVGYWNGLAGDGALNYTSLNFCTNLATQPVGTPASLSTLESLQNACYFADGYYASSTLNSVGATTLNIASAGIAIGTFNFANSAVTYVVTASDATGITGATAVTKSGDGTVVLDEDNTYSGGTVLSLGTLQLGNGDAQGSLGSGPVAVFGTLAWARTDDQTINNILSGDGLLTWAGPGTLTLSGANTFTGGATINSGTLVINNPLSQTLSGLLSGSGVLQQSGAGLLTLTRANSYGGGTTVSAGSALQLNNATGAGTGPVTLAGNASLTLNAAGTYSFSSIVGDSTSVLNVNEPTGNTVIAGDLSGFNGTINCGAATTTGQLVINSGYMPSANATWVLANGATLDLATPTTVDPAQVVISGVGNNQVYGSLRLDACDQQGAVLLKGPNCLIGDGNASAPSTISGVISDNAQGYGFTKVGNAAATITLTAANTYSGPTVINSGTLALSGSGSIASSSGISLANGTTLDVTAVNSGSYDLGLGQTLSILAGSATINGNLDASSGSPLSFQYTTANTPLTVAGVLTLNNNPVSVTLSSAAASAFATGTSVPLSTGISGTVASSPLTVSLPPNSSFTPGNAPSLSLVGGNLYLTVNSPMITSYAPYTYSNLFIFTMGVPPTFSVSAQGNPAPSYQWYSNGIPVLGATGPSLTYASGSLPAGSVATMCIAASSAGFATNSWVLNVVGTNGYAPYPLAVLQSTNAAGVTVPPVAYWRLGESDAGGGNGGRPCNDWLGGHLGVYTNINLGQAGYSPTLDPTETSARFGNYATANSYASIPGINFGAPNGTPVDFTIEMWLNAATTQTYAYQIFSQGEYGSDDDMEVAFGSSGSHYPYKFLARNAAGADNPLTGTAHPDGNWHHVVAVLDETHAVQLLYVDGVLNATLSLSSTNGGLYTPANTAMIIGAGTSTGTSYNQQGKGYVNEVAVYNYAMPLSTIQAHYNAKGTPPAVSLLASTNVDYGAPITLAPSSVVGTAPLYYSWTDINSQTLLASTPSLIIPSATTDTYILVVSNAFSPASTNTVTVLAYQGAPSFASPGYDIRPSSPTLYAGTPVTFSVLAYGNYPLSYQWYSGAGPIAGATGSSYTTATPQGTTSYYCVVNNGISPAATSSTATLTGLARPTGAYTLAVLDSNPPPVAYWPLAESPANNNTDGNYGALAYDYVGGHNATYNAVNLGLPGYNPVSSNTAAQFGTFTYPDSFAGEIDNSGNGLPNLDFSGNSAAFSVEAWVQATALYSDGEGIVAKGWNNGGEQFVLEANLAGWAFAFRYASAATIINCQSSVVPDSNWHHLVGVCDQPDGTARVYIDGVLSPESVQYNAAGQGVFEPSGASLPAVDQVSIGSVATSKSDTVYSGQFVGNIQDVALYNYALSPSQIAAHYAAGTNSMAASVALSITNLGNGSVQLNWNSGTLQGAPGLSGTFTDITNVAPYTVPATNPAQFFRVRQ